MMTERIERTTGGRTGSTASGVSWILLTGLLLGIGYNWIGLRSKPAWGLSWIAEDRTALLAEMPKIVAVETTGSEAYATDVSDPLAVGTTTALPEIPDVGRPVQIEIEALKQFFDAGAALIVDAREPDEFAVSHIPGAINIPYDTAVTDPALLESLDSGGRPIVTYCGGGSCELSINLADELFFAGHDRVAVYMGGYPEWIEAGYPTDEGENGR